MPHAVLIIEDEAVLAKNILIYLERYGYEVHLATSAEEGLEQLETVRPDAVLLDFKLPGMTGLEALTRIREFDAGIHVLMFTGHGNVEMAVEAMKAGAYDFLTKPVALGKLRLLLEKAIGQTRRDSALSYFLKRDEQNAVIDGLLGESPPMLALKQTIQQLLQAESQMRDADGPAVLVLGETGTGKEVVARALHFNGPRRDKPFVELNCAALPAQLLESELFGHERGAFTDARERKLGMVETAEGGTLFLDEIGDMDIALQAKLLKLLEEKTVRRIGSLREQKVNVRIVAATHRPLEARVREGAFRADLYFRLSVVQVRLPPLRERGADVLLLASHFLSHHAARYGKPTPALDADAEAVLQAHGWPGNVRELRNVIEQAVLLNSSRAITAQQLALSHLGAAPSPASIAAAPGAPDAARVAAESTLPAMERSAIVNALQLFDGNVSRAARELGISRDTMRYRMEKHGLEAQARPLGRDSR
jgi:two-component system, NtrC family, response regulator AtoC